MLLGCFLFSCLGLQIYHVSELTTTFPRILLSLFNVWWKCWLVVSRRTHASTFGFFLQQNKYLFPKCGTFESYSQHFQLEKFNLMQFVTPKIFLACTPLTPDWGPLTLCKIIHCLHPLLVRLSFKPRCGCDCVFCMLAIIEPSCCVVTRATS